MFQGLSQEVSSWLGWDYPGVLLNDNRHVEPLVCTYLSSFYTLFQQLAKTYFLAFFYEQIYLLMFLITNSLMLNNYIQHQPWNVYANLYRNRFELQRRLPVVLLCSDDYKLIPVHKNCLMQTSFILSPLSPSGNVFLRKIFFKL